MTYYPNPAYDSSTSSLRTHNHYVADTPVDVTNGADGTYYYYYDMSKYKSGNFQFVVSGGSGTVTLTIEGTLQDDGTAENLCEYEDISDATFSITSWQSNSILIDSHRVLGGFKYVRVKVVASTGGADDADWTIYSKLLG